MMSFQDIPRESQFSCALYLFLSSQRKSRQRKTLFQLQRSLRALKEGGVLHLPGGGFLILTNGGPTHTYTDTQRHTMIHNDSQ